MFNFFACPTFYNVSYKTPYVRNMSVSLLDLIGSINIALVSYAYSIHMECIPLLLVTGKLPVKYFYDLPVSGFTRPIAKNTDFVFSSLWGEILFHLQC